MNKCAIILTPGGNNMKNISNSKKAFLLLASYFIILFTPKTNKNKENTVTYNPAYQTAETLPYATYDNKQIYIISEEEANNMKEIPTDDIYVVDRRHWANSTMIIQDSYRIKNLKEMKGILNILMKYENEHPSAWDRTLTSMEKEWLIHNICYFLNYEPARTRHVDFDNADEENFSNLINILSQMKEIIDSEENNEKTKTHTLKK